MEKTKVEKPIEDKPKEENKSWLERNPWKAVIITAIITWLITTIFLTPLSQYVSDVFSAKPHIVSNVLTITYANISSNTTLWGSYKFLYYLGYNSSTMLFVNATDLENIKNYDMSLLPVFEVCPTCSLYSFAIKNIGNEKADRIEIDIKSSTIPKLIIDSPKIITKECGGIFESSGCYIVMQDLNENESIYFATLTENSDPIGISCLSNGKYPCDFNFVRIKGQSINSSEVLSMNGNLIIFPTPENSPINTLYYFNDSNPSKTTWTYFLNQ